jgi:hypothetical protein
MYRCYDITVKDYIISQSWAQLPLSVDLLVNGTALILQIENVNLTEERLFLSLLKASTLKIQFSRIFSNLTLSTLLFFCKLSV